MMTTPTDNEVAEKLLRELMNAKCVVIHGEDGSILILGTQAENVLQKAVTEFTENHNPCLGCVMPKTFIHDPECPQFRTAFEYKMN